MENILKNTVVKFLFVALGITFLLSFSLDNALAQDPTVVIENPTPDTTLYTVTASSDDMVGGVNQTESGEQFVDNDADFCATQYNGEVIFEPKITSIDTLESNQVFHMSGVLVNNKQFPIVDASLLARLSKYSENKDREEVKTTINEFYVEEAFSILGNTKSSFDFDWNVPAGTESGSYVIEFFVVENKKFITYGNLYGDAGFASGLINIDLGLNADDSARILSLSEGDKQIMSNSFQSWYKFPAVASYPLKEGEDNMVFTCFEPLGGTSTTTNSFVLTLKNNSGDIIHSTTYNFGTTSSDHYSAVKGVFKPEETYTNFTLTGEWYQDGKIYDTTTITYDCDELGYCKEGEASPHADINKIQSDVQQLFSFEKIVPIVSIFLLVVLFMYVLRSESTERRKLAIAAIIATIAIVSALYYFVQNVDAQVTKYQISNATQYGVNSKGSCSQTCKNYTQVFGMNVCTQYGPPYIWGAGVTYVLGVHNRCILTNYIQDGDPPPDPGGCVLTKPTTGVNAGQYVLRMGDEGDKITQYCTVLCNNINNVSGTSYGYGASCTRNSAPGVINQVGQCCSGTKALPSCGVPSDIFCGPPDPGSITYTAPTLTFTASPTTIASGASANLSWSSTDTTSCIASGAWLGAKAVNGISSTGSINSTGTYTLTCTGPGGNVSQSVTVTVNPPVTCNLPWGGTVTEGTSVTSYQSGSVTYPATCTSEQRVCQSNGALSSPTGQSYSNPSCSVTPVCTSSAASAPNTTATSGTFPVYAYGVSANTTAVKFPTWGDTGAQDDLVWYNGTNLGGGTWRGDINLANHKVGNPEYGNFNVHVYMDTATTPNTWCGVANFSRNYPNCPATTIGTCVLPSTAPGATSVGASCSVGYQGSCSYQCNTNGTWGGQLTNSCVLTTQCNDGNDNDGDGKTDSGGANPDPGCTSSTDNTEADPSLGSASATNCLIPDGASSCNSTVAWNISNPNSPSIKQGGTEFSTLASSAGVSRSIQYNGGLANIMTFHDTTGLLDSRTPTATCAPGTNWNGINRCSSTPQCNDGLDNDGTQGIDFGVDPDCTSATDTNESPDSANLELNASPKVVPQGQQTTISWNTHGANENLCTLTKNGTAVAPNPLTADDGPMDNIETGSFTVTIDAATTYRLTCGTRSKDLMISIVSTGFET